MELRKYVNISKALMFGKIIQMEYGLYSLKNNLEVVKIPDAARESAKTRKIILVKDYLKFQRT